MTILRNTAFGASAVALVAVAILATTDIGFAQNKRHAMWGGHGHETSAPHRQRGAMGPMMRGGQQLMHRFDVNEDRQITQEEVDQVQADRFSTGDQDGDGIVTLGEFETLWLEDNRSRLVDQFQALDADGDGQVTPEEFNQRVAMMIQMLDRNGDGILSIDDRSGGDREGPRRDRGDAPRGNQ